MNNDAVVTIFLGLSAFNKNKIGLKKIPPPIPTIPEVIDLYNTLSSGIYGVQMSEETAIGQYPKDCLNIIVKLMDEIESYRA